MLDDQARWVAQAKTGDTLAFRRLVEMNTSALFRTCVRVTGDKAIAEDAMQEAFFNAFRHLREFDERAQFSTWLHRIAVNAALEQMRRRNRVEEALPEAEDEDAVFPASTESAPGPDRHAHSEQIRRDVETQLSRMTVLERSAFLLRHHEGQSLEDISALLSLNISACKQAIFRAVRKLRLSLEPPG